jgi:hypothetical protein
MFGALGTNQWTAQVVLFYLIIEGTTEKMLQFRMTLKSIYKQNLGLIEQTLFF